MTKKSRLFPCGRVANLLSRREWLRRAGAGAGMIGLANLMAEQGLLAAAPTEGSSEPVTSLRPRRSHFPAKAKSVIWLFMEGAPSAVDMFDRKPELEKRDGETTDIQAFFGNPGPLMKSPFSFVWRMRAVGLRQGHQRGQACRQTGIHQVLLQRIE